MKRESKKTKVFACLGLLLLALLLLRGCGRDKMKPRSFPPTMRVSTLEEFNDVLARHAENLDESFRVPCTPKLHALLMGPSLDRSENELLGDIRCMNGSSGCTLSWDGDTLEFHTIFYYAGWRILNAVRNGREHQLNARERETLRAAKALVAGATGSPMERERRIHDALCNRIEYYTNNNTREEKDCAIGALLNGLADCDGYADAMMLCCGLAGIPCRYMNGMARDMEAVSASRISTDAGHMWNLVKISGRWVSVDVTWDDQDDGISYLSYNLGTEDAFWAYRWDPRAVFVKLAEETDSATQLMPDLRRTVVRSLEEVYRAARQATLGKVRRFTFVCPGLSLWKTEKKEFHNMLSRGGWDTYSYSSRGRMLEVTNIQTERNIRFCDTEEEALDAIRDFADVGERSFSLFFRPVLADALLADDCDGLTRLLSRSQLEKPGTYRYSTQSGSVTLENVDFIPPPMVCRSERDLHSMLRRELAKRPATLAFLVPDGFDSPATQKRWIECVHSMGVNRFTWSSIGVRIRLQDLEY